MEFGSNVSFGNFAPVIGTQWFQPIKSFRPRKRQIGQIDAILKDAMIAICLV